MGVNITYICNTKDCTKEIEKLTKSMKGSEKAGKKSGGVMKDLAKNWKLIAAGAGVAVTAVVAAKKAFDMAAEGAAIAQTHQSWKGLLSTLGVAPSLLNDLKKASKGTVSELDLMQSTTTLLMGTSKELGSIMAVNAPALMEIAKASHKLNPALGTTEFLYKSLNEGVKRNSALKIDNAGVIISAAVANEKYAKKIGKTAKMLTVEEQKAALLYETIEQGEEIIKQAGASGDDMTDAYERLGIMVEENTDKFKIWLAEGLWPVIDAIVNATDHKKEQAEAIKGVTVVLDKETKAWMFFDETQTQVIGTIEEIKEARKRDAEEMDRYGKQLQQLGYVVEEELDDMKGGAEDTGEAFSHMWDKVIPDPIKMLEGMEAWIEYMQSDMPAVIELLDNLDTSIQNGTSSVETFDTVQEMLKMQFVQNLLDMGLSAEDVAEKLELPLEKVEGIRDGLIETLTTKEINIYIHEHYRKSYYTDPEAHKWKTKKDKKATGGPLGMGVHEVGEAGWEYVINGVVIPHHQSVEMKRLGLMSQGGFQGGGIPGVPVGYGAGYGGGPEQIYTGGRGGAYDPYTAALSKKEKQQRAPSAPATAAAAEVAVVETQLAVEEAVHTEMGATVRPEAAKQTLAITQGMIMQSRKQDELIALARQTLDVLQDQASADDLRSIQEDAMRTTGY